MSDKLNVLYFSAPWCGPCRAFGPAFDEVVKSFEGEINVQKVNVDDEPTLAADHAVRSIPTLVFVKDGKEVFRNTGVLSKLKLTEELEKHK